MSARTRRSEQEMKAASSKSKFITQSLGPAAGFLLVLSVGILLLFSNFRLGEALIRSSYDWSFDLGYSHRPNLQNSEVVLVYLDEESHKTLDQPFNKPWDRALHAQLLDRLRAGGASAVVFDIIFSDPGPSPEADEAFAEAIRKNGRVILASEYTASGSSSGQLAAPTRSVALPYEPFRTNAAGWGLATLQLEQEQDFTVRRHFSWLRERNIPSLGWAAGEVAGVELTRHPEQASVERWVKYYGGPETIPNVNYVQALYSEVAPGFFRDKIVFVGARPMTGTFAERRDELRSPFSSYGRVFRFMPAVEVHATEMLNLVRGDWLRRLPPASEIGLLFIVAVLFGVGLLRFKPLLATVAAIGGGLAVVAFALAFFKQANVLFPWMIVVAAQIPVALLWSIVFKSVEWYFHRRHLEEERQRAEQQIREQAALLDKAQDAIIVHDLDWRASFWNKSAERLYGWTAPEVLQQSLAESILNGDPAKLQEAKRAVVESGEWMGELKQKTKAGSHITVQSRWSLVRDSTGSPKSILIINTDMTEQKKLEAQFLRTQRMESIGTLAGGIAHDLNNVLSPIVMGVEMLQMKSKDANSQKLLKSMAVSARRGADMVKQVLTFARGQEGERAPIQLSHLVKEMQKIVRETFSKSIEIATMIDGDLWPVLGDVTQWHQVLLNLCVNARDAMPEGGKIRIGAANATLTEADAKRLLGAKPMKYVLLSVTDTGEGIPPEIIDKIFEPFFTTKEIGKGTGLGLSTVISIVKNHGAVLDLKSVVGQGTTFDIYIPALESATVSAPVEIPLEQLKGNGQRILVVDDEPAMLDVTQSTLTSHGYQVATACHGAEALSLCMDEKQTIDLALIDLNMPVMDGPKAIRALRRVRPELRFIAMSGLQQSDKIKDLIQAQELLFLPKPITTEKLLLTLRDALARPAKPENPAGTNPPSVAAEAA